MLNKGGLFFFFLILAVDQPNIKNDTKGFDVPQILAERCRVISQQGIDKPKELHDPLVLP